MAPPGLCGLSGPGKSLQTCLIYLQKQIVKLPLPQRRTEPPLGKAVTGRAPLS